MQVIKSKSSTDEAVANAANCVGDVASQRSFIKKLKKKQAIPILLGRPWPHSHIQMALFQRVLTHCGTSLIVLSGSTIATSAGLRSRNGITQCHSSYKLHYTLSHSNCFSGCRGGTQEDWCCTEKCWDSCSTHGARSCVLAADQRLAWI